jgi:hypothetical protein
METEKYQNPSKQLTVRNLIKNSKIQLHYHENPSGIQNLQVLDSLKRQKKKSLPQNCNNPLEKFMTEFSIIIIIEPSSINGVCFQLNVLNFRIKKKET